MKFTKEFKYAYLSVLILVLIIILFSFTKSVRLQIFFSLLSIIAGSVMIVLGFWGSDFAFALASGHLDQSRERGKIKGRRKKVIVPFMRNYSPLEWWNLNWFLTLYGSVLLAFGMLTLGIVVGVYVY